MQVSNGQAGGQSRLLSQDFLAGLFFCAIALVGLWAARDYPVGTAMRIDTGVFPRLLCWTLLLLGIGILVNGLRGSTGPVGRLAWRPFFFVLLAVIFFGIFIEKLGMVITVAGLMVIASFGSPERHWRELAVFVALVVTAAVVIFAWGLGLPIPVWPV